jgi:hypothetical protein
MSEPTSEAVVHGDQQVSAGYANAEPDKEWTDEALKTDPEYQRAVEAEKTGAEKTAKPKKDEKPTDQATGEQTEKTTDQAADQPSTEEKHAEKTTPEESAQETPAPEDTDAEFEDNVIEGVTGKDFGALPEPVQTALASYHERATETEEKLTATEKQLATLLNDPIVKHRATLIDQNKGDLQYEIPGLTAEEKTELKTKLGLDDEELTAAEKIFNAIAEKKARPIAYNLAMADKAKSETEKSIINGRNHLLSLSKFNKSLDAGIKAEEIDEILQRKDRHPKWKRWSSGIGKVYDWCVAKGMNYQAMMKLTPEALYAAAAAELKMPVAPSPDVLKQLTADVKRKALAKFYKPSKAKEAQTLRSDQGNVDRRAADKVTVIEGLDAERVASDASYYEQVLNRRPGDKDWHDKVNSIVSKGEAILKQRRKT